MKILKLNIVKFSLCLIIGILLSSLIPIALHLSFYITAFCIGFQTINYFMARNQLVKTISFGLTSFITMISIGILTVNVHNEINFSNHYTKAFTSPKKALHTTFRIREVLKPNNYYNKYIVDVLKINNNIVSGKTLLNIKKDTSTNALKVGRIFISKTDFKELPRPLNPGEFNYKSYLNKKYIYHQIFTSEQALFKVNSKSETLLGLANGIREHINNKLRTQLYKPDELAVINALLLGQRRGMSPEVYTSYVNAGAVHILAVSGLHVGIILMLLNFILKPIEYLKYGKTLKILLLVIALWGFAVIAGLSASVTRAVTMFSILAIAINLKRPSNIYNILALSMLVILLFKPLFLFSVGFQLSYAAVFSIVTIDPLLYKLWTPKNKLLDIYWHTLTVTISAQIGIIPISLYYFHQFPGLFFISNLIIIPLLGLILGFGILVIALAIFNILPNAISIGFAHVIRSMNWFVKWIAKYEQFLITDIPFNFLYLTTTYMLIFCGIHCIKNHNYSSLKFLMITIIISQLAFIGTINNKPNNQLIVFHKSRNSLIGHIKNDKLIIASDFDSITKATNQIITNFTVQNHISTIEEDTLKPIYLLNTKKLLVIDSFSVYRVKSFNPDYVLLRHAPKLNLNRLIDSLKPKQIIADGSNYKSYVKHWKSICKKRKLPFHSTSEKGAYIIKY